MLTLEDTTQFVPFVKSRNETTMNIFVSTFNKNESFLRQSQHNTQRSIIEKRQ